MRTDRWATMPGIGVALLPKLVCPLCWPAYAGIVSALGLGFLIQAQYLFAITALFLVVALAALSFRARSRHGYYPALLGLAAAVAILVGKFGIESKVALYVGVALLLAASIWNAWPKRNRPCCASSTVNTNLEQTP